MSDITESAESPAAEPAPPAEAPSSPEPAPSADAPDESGPSAEAPAADEAEPVSETAAEEDDGPVSGISDTAESDEAAEAPASVEPSAEIFAADEAEAVPGGSSEDEALPAIEVSLPEDPAPDGSDVSPVPETAADGEAAPAEEAAAPAAPVADTLFMETETVTVSRSAANAGQSASKVTIGGKDVSAKDGWKYDEESGQIGLVDFDKAGVDIVSSGLSGLNIAAAGVNHIRSIVSEGNVNVTGTGFLLLDSVTLGTGSGFYLHTPTDVYEDGTGSVAVFLKQNNGTYLLVNGSVPGILDEEYTLENVDLVIPGGSSLLINSGGTIYNKDTGEVVLRYTGNDRDVKDIDISDPKYTDCEYEETFGSLTLKGNSSLTVKKGAEIRMESTWGLKTYAAINVPVLSAEDNASLNVAGKISGDGTVDLRENTSLSGKGSVEAREIFIHSTNVLSDCGVTLRSDPIYLYGGGTIPCLFLDDAEMILEYGNPGVTIKKLNSSGDSAIVNPNKLTIESIVNSGTLSLYSGHPEPTAEECVVLSGTISGGTLQLNSGLFCLIGQYALKGGATIACEDVVVYDYIGSSDHFTAPLIVSPDKAQELKPRLSEDGSYYAVPLVVVNSLFSEQKGGRVKTEIYPPVEDSEVYFIKNTDGKYVLDFDSNYCFKDLWNPLDGNQDKYVVIETQSIDGENLSFDAKMVHDFKLSDLDKVELGDIYMVRIHILDYEPPVLPAVPATSTNTSFTGTGILGGAGTLNGGGMSLILRGPSAEEPEPASTTTRKTAAAPRTDWRVVVSESGRYYKVKIYYGTQEIAAPGQKVTARMDFTLPDGWDSDAIFAVFRNANGKLTAFKATYDAETGTLRFDTDLTGIFALVSFPFDGRLYSQAFYDALSELDVIEDLPVRR